jgi:hypothetical protein
LDYRDTVAIVLNLEITLEKIDVLDNKKINNLDKVNKINKDKITKADKVDRLDK